MATTRQVAWMFKHDLVTRALPQMERLGTTIAASDPLAAAHTAASAQLDGLIATLDAIVAVEAARAEDDHSTHGKRS